MDIAMKMLKINDSLPEVSAIGLGCMRLAGLEDEKAVGALIDVCMEEGINFFDHAVPMRISMRAERQKRYSVKRLRAETGRRW